MSINAEVSFNPGDLGSTYCFSTWQQLYLDMITQLTGFLPGNFSTFNFGDATPDADNRDKPWIRTVGGALDRLYVYVSGVWSAPHPTPASGSERRLWVGNTTDLQTYDGGSVGAVTAFSGPMWEVDANFAAVMPIGPGTLPSGTAIAVGGTGGVEDVTLTKDQIPPHIHRSSDGSSFLTNKPVGNFAGGANPIAVSSNATDDGSADGLGGNKHTNMPPYRGVFFIKRTSRIYYTV